MELGVRLLYMLSLLAVGVGARHVGLLAAARRDRLTAVAFYVTLPALIFLSTSDQPLDELLSVELVAGLWLVLFAVVAASWLVHRRTDPRSTRSIAMVQSYHGNFGFLGLPLVAVTLGTAAAGRGSIILGVGALTQVPLTVLLLISMNDAEASVASELRSLATNPVLIALAVGLVASVYSLSLPTVATTTLSWLADLALPLALVLVGSALELRVPDSDWQALGGVVGLKVFLMPIFAWIAFSALGADPLTRNAAVVMFGAPTAVSTFIYANELGGDAEFASVAVFATTLVSVGTLGVALQLLV
jgi:predicted permease